MKTWIMISLLWVDLIARQACAGPQFTTFTEPAQFAAATTDFEMALENFEAANIEPLSSASMVSPLSAATSNSIFTAGTIAPGVQIQSVPEPANIRVLGVGSEYFNIGPATSKLIVAQSDANAFDLVFSPPVMAVGLTLFSESDTVGISYFGADGLLAALPVTAPDDTGGYLGILSIEPIVRVRVNAPSIVASGHFEGIDDLSFGLPRIVFRDSFEPPQSQ
jgi:hypothetical protein